jgi:cephalosporin-C deacetylase
MARVDVPREELVRYCPAVWDAPELRSFWETTTAEALQALPDLDLAPHDLPARSAAVFAVRFPGFGGGTVTGWYLKPHGDGPFPGVVFYHGYTRRAARPLDLLHLAAEGFACLSLDVRGQGGEATDGAVYEGGRVPGWMTAGIASPATYYYRNVYMDCVRALERFCEREEIDAGRIAVTGISQGGGLSLAAAALSRRPALVMAEVPFLCDFRRALDVATAGPYLELARYLRERPEEEERVWETLRYFDVLNLAPWVTARTVITCGLWDEVCPPSTVYGVFNTLRSEKEIMVYPYMGHETVYDWQRRRFGLLVELGR